MEGTAASAHLTARTEESWQRWLDALARVPSDQIDVAQVCGEWSVKDLLGHVAVWDAVAIAKIREIQEGVPWQREEVDQRNAREAADRADRSPDEQRAEMQMTHQRLLTALDAADSLSSAELTRIGDTIAEDTWEHYAEHTAQVQRWLGGHTG